jgi:hypothetical protein
MSTMSRIPACFVTLASLSLFVTGSQAQTTRPVSIGANANYEQELARAANLGWSRIDVLWRDINPAPGTFSWSASDAQINNAVADGQQILAILHVVPSWANGGKDEDVPPLSTTAWSEFVRQVAQRYRGKIAAYEIWNEPDTGSTSQFGIGWGRNIEEPPLYVDFLHAAAVEIRAQAPGTLVVGPAFMSRNNGSGVDNRKRRILQQITAANYPDGPGTNFIDVISVHNNAGDTEHELTMGNRLNYENLAYVWNHAPAIRTKPVWVTEFGYRANAVGWNGQRDKICRLVKVYTAGYGASSTDLDDWDVRRGFIYVLIDRGNSTSRAIYTATASPLPVVTQYLQRLAYPAVQNPGLPTSFPNCSGAALLPGGLEQAEDLGERLARLGLGDLRGVLPTEFSEVESGHSVGGESVDAVFRSEDGGRVLLHVSSASPLNAEQSLTDAGAEWTRGAVHVSLSGSRAGGPLGNELVRQLATAIDPEFDELCLTETVTADERTLTRLGYLPPAAPAGFEKASASIELTRPTSGCEASAPTSSQLVDATWTFHDGRGATMRAGLYRYNERGRKTVIGPRSLHWSDDAGTWYWVAADPGLAIPELRDKLLEVALSMDPEFAGR